MKPYPYLAVSVLLLFPLLSSAHIRYSPRIVSIEIVSDDGVVMPVYATQGENDPATHRAFLEARRDQRYGIRVTNLSAERIGVVIAVDGRNIISGQRSELAAGERMYILNPYQQATYRGWRTGRDTVNRFFFTAAGASYAGAWGDHSAMGVIAAAVYRENAALPAIGKADKRHRYDAPAAAAESMARRESKAAASGRALAEAGTGFGEQQASHARIVQFDPQPQASERHFLKYEWRQVLCQRGIVACSTPPNRFWPGQPAWSGFAPYPPG